MKKTISTSSDYLELVQTYRNEIIGGMGILGALAWNNGIKFKTFANIFLGIGASVVAFNALHKAAQTYRSIPDSMQPLTDQTIFQMIKSNIVLIGSQQTIKGTGFVIQDNQQRWIFCGFHD